jgi:uncharacterized protein
MHHAYRTALVTGASGGIGERLARLMAGLIVVARAAGRLAGLADDLRDAHHVPAEVLAADLTTSAGLREPACGSGRSRRARLLPCARA